jgi:hypothetical protein
VIILVFHLKSHRHTTKKGKKQKYHTFGTVSKPNTKIVERAKLIPLYTSIHDHSFSWFDTGILMGGGGF